MTFHERPAPLGLDEAIRRRRSVRGFKPQEAPEALLREAFALAQFAPSNCNAQPWAPHVASGETLKRLTTELIEAARTDRPIAPDYEANWRFAGIYRDRQIDAAQKLYAAMGVERRDHAGRRDAYLRNFAAFDAPHVAFVFMPDNFGVREAADVGMWAQTLMLALSARGLASCAQGALSLYPDIVRAHLGLGSDRKLLFGIAIGYEDEEMRANAARVGRAELEHAVHFYR